jgi:DNA-directed RNA polymerase specialized sigma subunit
MFAEIEKTYLPQIDIVIEKNFPEYAKKIKNLTLSKRKEIPILTQEEILDLYSKYKNGDLKSRDLIVYSQLKLVYLYTKKFHGQNNGTNITEDDLLGFANLILLEILDTYNPYIKKENGAFNSLSSYIRTWLEYNLHSKLKEFGLTIKLPANKITEIAFQKKCISKYEQKYCELPKNGDSVIYTENGITKKIIFDIAEEKILVFEKEANEFKIKKISKFECHELFEIVSGNENVVKNDDLNIDLLDSIESSPLLEPDFNETVVRNAIDTVINNLTDRERECISLFYYDETPLKNIPALIKPDLENKNELKTLSRTSFNKIIISATEKNGEKVFIEYNIVANHHVECLAQEPIKSQKLKPISHKNSCIQTNEHTADFLFEINMANIDNIQIIHETSKATVPIEFKLNAQELSFKINYSYGMIFTPQTFLNNNETLLKKLRSKLIKIKKIVN